MNSIIKSIGYYYEKYCAKSSWQDHDYSKLPDELLKIIIDQSDLSALKNLNQTCKQLNIITETYPKYTQEKRIQNLVMRIVSIFKQKINISPYHQGSNLKTSMLADKMANEQCSGLSRIPANEKKEFIIKYQAGLISIPIDNCNSKLNESLYPFFSGYQCRFTETAEITLESDDNDLSHAALIAQKEINKLLEANSRKARDLRILN